MPFNYGRHVDGPTHLIFAADNNELQQGIESVSKGVWNVVEPVDSAQSSNYARGDGITDDAGAFALADANNAGNGVTYAPPTSARYLFSASKTLAHALKLPPSAILKPASAQTITINGPLDAGPYQIFDTSAGGAATVGAATVLWYPQWWTGGATGVLGVQNTIQLGSPTAVKPIQLADALGVGGRRLSIQAGDPNGSAEVQLIPGSGLNGSGGMMSQMQWFNATGANYERFAVSAIGNTYIIDSTFNGAGIAQAVVFQMGGSVGAAAQTTLAASCLSTDTTITVSSTAGLGTTAWSPPSGSPLHGNPGNNRILIDTEYMTITAIAGNVLTVTRATEGSLAAAHSSGAGVSLNAIAGQNALTLYSDASVDLNGASYTWTDGLVWGATRTRIADRPNTGTSALIIDTRTGSPSSVTADSSYIDYRRGGSRKWAVGLNYSGLLGDTFDWYNTSAGRLCLSLSATGNVFIGNTTSTPPTPVAGGQLYVSAGALVYKGSSGTITTLAVA